MAQYQLRIRYIEGEGQILLNGVPANDLEIIEEETLLEIEAIPSDGFFFERFTVSGNRPQSTDNPFLINMPNEDLRISIFANGARPEVTDYGLKYFSKFCDIDGKETEIQILEKGYEGASTKKDSSDVVFRFGNFGGNEFQTIIRSSLDFSLVGMRNEFDELLDGGFRKWQVKLLRNDSLFWTGYINNSILSKRIVGYEQPINLTASDGTNGWNSQRALGNLFDFYGQGMGGSLISMLNQTFPEKRNVNFACDIYETRLNRSASLFHQLRRTLAAFYTQGETPEFISGTQERIRTEYTIDKAVENILRPFLCRCFIWDNEFYIVSVPEFAKADFTSYKYDFEGDLVGSNTINSGDNISCSFTDAIEEGRPVFTEFTGVLKLGVLDPFSRGGVYEVSFGIESWQSIIFFPLVGVQRLRNWTYRNAVASPQPSSYPTGSNPALIQYASDAIGERCKIWGTTSADGLSDPNISYIESGPIRTGELANVVQEGANTISFDIEYLCEKRRDSSPDPTVNQKCGVMLRIGDQWLQYTEPRTFTWVGTPTVMLFPLPNVNAWNKIEIGNLVAPTTGAAEIRLYEIVTTGFTDEHTISFRNLSLKIEENEEFTLQDLVAKFITDEEYSNVDSDYETLIGDVPTKNSTSAILLDIAGQPNSELWSRDGIEELPLMQIILQEIANVRGVQNPRINLVLTRKEGDPFDIKPYQNIVFEGRRYMVNALEIDLLKNFWKLEIIKVGEI